MTIEIFGLKTDQACRQPVSVRGCLVSGRAEPSVTQPSKLPPHFRGSRNRIIDIFDGETAMEKILNELVLDKLCQSNSVQLLLLWPESR
ncbi:hypothetical protein pipiens_011216 [Culex pipiens pipiens]|uniref:Uncharacterized protein n=1 Tax=Culex pipiens pipiens TaxID=38569 RepID=A0ABD1D779_CULPP